MFTPQIMVCMIHKWQGKGKKWHIQTKHLQEHGGYVFCTFWEYKFIQAFSWYRLFFFSEMVGYTRFFKNGFTDIGSMTVYRIGTVSFSKQTAPFSLLFHYGLHVTQWLMQYAVLCRCLIWISLLSVMHLCCQKMVVLVMTKLYNCNWNERPMNALHVDVALSSFHMKHFWSWSTCRRK
jgi:hypothetical protein